MNNTNNFEMEEFTFENNYFQFREGDPILVITSSGATFTGIFLRIQRNFLLWVRNVNGMPRITLTALTNITITKL